MKKYSLLYPSLLLVAALLGNATAARADAYPAKPLRLIVGYAPGGATDVIARLVGQRLGEALGQAVIVENRPGANGSIGAEVVARAAPDGYTLFMCTIANVINTSLYPKLPFDFVRDFAPVSLVATIPNMLVVNPAVAAKDLKEFIALAKSNPGQINFASPGSGSSPHLSGELFKTAAGVSMVHIPYKGSAPAMSDLIGGQVQAMFDNMPSALPHVKAGKLRALAVTGANRSAAAMNIPTMDEAGLPGYQITSWFGVALPVATPKEIVQKLNMEIVKVLNRPDIRERLAGLGADVAPSSTEEFASYIMAETAKWAETIKVSGAKVD